MHQEEHRSGAGRLLSARRLLTLQLIHLGMLAGIIIFGVVTVAVDFGLTAHSPRPALARVLSLVHVALATVSYPVAIALFRVLLSRTRLTRLAEQVNDRGTDPVEAYFGLIQTAYLVRLALLEGVALFGLVAILIMGKDTLAGNPVYWLNNFSPIVFILVNLATWPTKDRLEMLLREREML